MNIERFVTVEDVIQSLHLDGVEPTVDNVKLYLENVVGRPVERGQVEVYLDAYAEEPDTAIDLMSL